MESVTGIFQIVMLVLLFVTLGARSVLLFVTQRVNPFVLGKGKRGLKALIEYGFFIGLLLWAFEVVAAGVPLSFHLFPAGAYAPLVAVPWLAVVGMSLTVVGYVLFVLSLIAFGNSWRVGIDKEHPGRLVTAGVFSFTRNPIFVYIDLYFIGTALIQPSVFFIASALIAVTGMHLQILQEEKFLASRYGDEYLAYKKKVRRYV